MPSSRPCALVASESGIARGFAQVILSAHSLETRSVSSPEQARIALRAASGEARAHAVLRVDASPLKSADGPGHGWSRLLRERPALPVVCLELDGGDRAPPELAGRVRAFGLAPRAEPLRVRTRPVPGRSAG